MKVRVGSLYHYWPCGWDEVDPTRDLLQAGDLVRVINLPGCPPANTMGHCYVHPVGFEKEAFQLVMTASLFPFAKEATDE